MSKSQEQINRMKAMMVYGLQTESKKPYSVVEYYKTGADGKTYGILREGSKYIIKVSNKKENPLKENFDYIDGYMNHKNYEYDTYANALKQFDMKMISLKESCDNKTLMVESWNPDANEYVKVEATEKMKQEIARQRQIMENAGRISSSKNTYTVSLNEGCSKNGICTNKAKEVSPCKGECGNKSPKGGDPFTENPDLYTNIEKNNISKKGSKKAVKKIKENSEVLGWNDDEDFIDTTNGTEVGDGTPFSQNVDSEFEYAENGNMVEGVALHKQENNLYNPKPGTNKIGKSFPFDEKIKEDIESDDEIIDDDNDENVFDVEVNSETDDDFDSEDDVEERLGYIEDMLDKIADKLGVSDFDDDKLYDDDFEDDEDDFEDDEDDFEDDEDDFEDDEDDFEDDEDDFEDDEDDFEDDEDDFEDEDTEVFESKNYRKMRMNEEKFDDFGKHPAYRKKVMTLPSNNHQDKDGYYDMNDDSVESESPYGERIGDSTPFEVNPEEIVNSIAESIKRIMKKKI